MIKSVEKKEIRVPAHIDYLGDLRDFVTQIGKKHGFSDKMINAFKLAVDEAATNIIRHAYRDKEGLITIRAYVKKNSLTLSIIDQGTYFDPKRVKDPDLKRYIDIGKKGGLGIFIMRKLMDEIDYRKTEEGNELRITKNREILDKKKNIIKSVSTIPFSIKAKYFFRTLAVVTAIIALGYFYFFLKADNTVLSEFISNSRLINKQIINRIRSAPEDEFEFVDDIVHPIFEEYQGQIYQITVEDSTGTVTYSSNIGDMLNRFYRPKEAEQVNLGFYKYTLRDTEVFEFEEPLVIKANNRYYGKVHVYYETEPTLQQIRTIRLNYLNLALLIFGISNVGVALLIYLVMNPFRKLSDWIKNLGTEEEVHDAIDIESGTEIGEIAQAFSGITKKLRESQKNLADQERLQKEMQVAKEIQQTLLPMEFPHLEGYELSSYYEAAKEVGGDYYDFVEVDKDTLGIAIADVSGKGVPGSLVMTMIRTALRTEARGIKDAAEVLSRVNAFVSNDIKKGMFVTVFYLIIDSKRRSVNYASAGHNPMILYRGRTQKTYYLNPKGFPIGVQLPEKDLFRRYIESDTIKLSKDDILLIYTDGITEAMNSRRELYGEERLLKVIRDYGHLSAEEFVEKLKDDIYSFTEGSPQYDDISLVAIKEESSREEDELRRAKEAHTLISRGMSIKEACESVNLTTYAYYNKYKKVFDEEGIESFEIDQTTSVEAKHISIEDKTKLFDVIARHPEYGAARIKDELNTEKYGFCTLTETQIYEELVRSKLNTRQLREAYVARGKKTRVRLKPPGTPLLTLDGQIILKKHEEPFVAAEPEEEPEPADASADSLISDSTAELFSGAETTDAGTPGDTAEMDEAGLFIEQPLEEVLQHADETVDFDAQEETESAEVASVEELIVEDLDASEGEDATDDRPKEGETAVTDDEGDTETSFADDHADLGETQSPGFEELVSTDSHIEFNESIVSEELTEEEEATATDDHHPADAKPDFTDSFPGGAKADETAGTVAEADEMDADQNLTSASLEELLDASYEESFEEDEEQEPEEGEEVPASAELLDDSDTMAEPAEPPSASVELNDVSENAVDETQPAPEPPTEKIVIENPSPVGDPEEDLVSFSDLIQAIDDEIVYVKDYEKAGGTANKDSVQVQVPPEETEIAENTNGKEGLQSPSSAKTDKKLPNKELILINGIRYYKNNDYENAIREFQKVIDLHPDYKEAHSILGNAYFRNEMYDEAAVAYARVKEIDPTDVTAYENMGVIYANRGDYKNAVEEWKKVLELKPERTDIEEKIQKAMKMLV